MQANRTSLTASAASFAALLLAFASASAQTPAPFKLGAVLNLSGPTAEQGADFRRGLELAAQTWNDKGGVGGKKIELIFEDHAAQPARAVTGAQKLIQVDGVKVLANVYSSPVLAVVPIAERARVLQVSAGATSPRLVNISKYFMTSVVNAGFEAEVALAFARKKLNAKKIAILYGNDDFGTGMRDAVVKLWEKDGGAIVASEGQDPTKTDFQSVVAKISVAKPDAVYVALAGGNTGAAVKQLREGGVAAPLLSHQGFEGPELFSVGGGAGENSYWTSAAVTISQDREKAFADAFKAKFSRDPTIFARTHFDLGMSVLQAIENLSKQNKELTAENVRAALLELGVYTGVLGAFSYREDGTAVRALDLKTMKDGKSTVFMNSAEISQQGIINFEAAK